MEPKKQVSICCGVERSIIYPRDCWKCGGLFIPGICYNRAETKPEAIPLMMQLFDLIIKLKQSGN